MDTESDPILASWQERLRTAATQGTPLRLRGGGTKDFYGQTPKGEIFDTNAYRGIVKYVPSELVITARCGTPLAEIEAALEERKQILAFEPPHFASPPRHTAKHANESKITASTEDVRNGMAATLGGCIASGLSGPRRAGVGPCAGAMRDFILGAKVMDGRGEILTFGGQVMKNVAGFDASRLFAGSLGVLGVILQVSLKVMPRLACSTTLRLECAQEEAMRSVNTWSAAALPISASFWHDGCLTLRLCGANAAVDAARRTIGGEPMDEHQVHDFWASVRDQTHPFFVGDEPDTSLWRIAVPATSPTLNLPGAQAIEWNGALRWCKSDAMDSNAIQTIRTLARDAGGHATLFRAPPALRDTTPVFQPLDKVAAAIHRNLKDAFDPAGIFNPGRMFPEPTLPLDGIVTPASNVSTIASALPAARQESP